jgi:ATP-dependent RNA helicase RhlE
MPATADDYIHRIGRTGRAERTGDAFTLATADDKDVIRAIEKIMGKPLPRQTLEGFDYTAPPAENTPSNQGRGVSVTHGVRLAASAPRSMPFHSRKPVPSLSGR